MLGLSGKANKCSDAGTGDLGGLTTHETSPLKLAGTLQASKKVVMGRRANWSYHFHYILLNRGRKWTSMTAPECLAYS